MLMLIVVPGDSTGTAVVGPRLSAYPDVSGVALQYQLLARCPNPQLAAPGCSRASMWCFLMAVILAAVGFHCTTLVLVPRC